MSAPRDNDEALLLGEEPAPEVEPTQATQEGATQEGATQEGATQEGEEESIFGQVMWMEYEGKWWPATPIRIAELGDAATPAAMGLDEDVPVEAIEATMWERGTVPVTFVGTGEVSVTAVAGLEPLDHHNISRLEENAELSEAAVADTRAAWETLASSEKAKRKALKEEKKRAKEEARRLEKEQEKAEKERKKAEKAEKAAEKAAKRRAAKARDGSESEGSDDEPLAERILRSQAHARAEMEAAKVAGRAADKILNQGKRGRDIDEDSVYENTETLRPQMRPFQATEPVQTPGVADASKELLAKSYGAGLVTGHDALLASLRNADTMVATELQIARESFFQKQQQVAQAESHLLVESEYTHLRRVKAAATRRAALLQFLKHNAPAPDAPEAEAVKKRTDELAARLAGNTPRYYGELTIARPPERPALTARVPRFGIRDPLLRKPEPSVMERLARVGGARDRQAPNIQTLGTIDGTASDGTKSTKSTVLVMGEWRNSRHATMHPAERDVQVVPAPGALSQRFSQVKEMLDRVATAKSSTDLRPQTNLAASSIVNLSRFDSRGDLQMTAGGGDDAVKLTLAEIAPPSASVGLPSPSPLGAASAVHSEAPSSMLHLPSSAVFADSAKYQETELSAPHFSAGDDTSSHQRTSQRDSQQQSRGTSEQPPARTDPSWKDEASRVVRGTLSRYLHGTDGKDTMIPSPEEFADLARKLTTRAYENRLHRRGQSAAFRASFIPASEFTTGDKVNLKAAVDTYMKQLAKERERRNLPARDTRRPGRAARRSRSPDSYTRRRSPDSASDYTYDTSASYTSHTGTFTETNTDGGFTATNTDVTGAYRRKSRSRSPDDKSGSYDSSTYTRTDSRAYQTGTDSRTYTQTDSRNYSSKTYTGTDSRTYTGSDSRTYTGSDSRTYDTHDSSVTYTHTNTTVGTHTAGHTQQYDESPQRSESRAESRVDSHTDSNVDSQHD